MRRSLHLKVKLSAYIWHFATALALLGTFPAFATDCESHLESPLFQATRYFSYEALSLKSEDALRAMLPGLDRILPLVQAQRAALSEQMKTAWSEKAVHEWNRLEQDEKNIKQMSAAV